MCVACVCTLGNEKHVHVCVALDGETRERKGGKRRERERVGVRRREVGRKGRREGGNEKKKMERKKIETKSVLLSYDSWCMCIVEYKHRLHT